MTTVTRASTVIAFLASIVACSSSNNGGGGGGAAAGTLAKVHSETLGVICVHCHAGASAPAGLDMSTQALAFQNLVNVKAGGSQSVCGGSGLTRVVPGHSDQSLMFMKVSGTAPCGGRMPLDNPPLSDGQIADIKAWIDDGALND